MVSQFDEDIKTLKSNKLIIIDEKDRINIYFSKYQ